MELKKRLQELERCCQEKERELMRQLDEATLAASQAALERTRLANEKLHLKQELHQREAQEAEFVCERKDTEKCLLVAKERLEKEVCRNCCVGNLRSLSLSVCLSSLYGDIYIEVITKSVVFWINIVMWRSFMYRCS
jgi:hypothetical protein